MQSVLGSLDSGILRAWRFFKSLKMGILLLAMIGAVCVYGTMGYASNAALGNNQIPMARKMVFQSPWFAGLLVLFAVQLVLSTWHVTLMSLGIGRRREFRRDPGYFEPSGGGAPRATVPFSGTDEELHSELSRRFSRVHRDGDAWFAHRGLRTRVGPTVVHAGMIIVLAAGLVRFIMVQSGRIVSEGRFIAAEGEFSNAIWEPVDESLSIGGGNVKAREIPGQHYIRVLDFDEDQHANIGSPKYFSSLVEITDPSTGVITVRQLDMNHSTAIEGLEFHQAGYEAMQEERPTRFLFDVRSRASKERIAVTDASANTPVRIGETDYHLIVDGTHAGAKWQIFRRDDPMAIHASGILGGTGGATMAQFSIVAFYPDFAIDREKMEPYNASEEPRNPAAQLVTFVNGDPASVDWLFLDRELAALTPPQNPHLRFDLHDIQVPANAEKPDWQTPGAVRFLVDVAPRDGSGTTQTLALVLGEKSPPRPLPARQADTAAATGSEKDFEVLLLGPTTRYMTILSVTNEPTTPLTTGGVIVILIGAIMTFSGRYEALYGLRDPRTGELKLALVPRWGYGTQAARLSLGELVEALSRGRGGRLLEPSVAAAPDDGIAQPQALAEG